MSVRKIVQCDRCPNNFYDDSIDARDINRKPDLFVEVREDNAILLRSITSVEIENPEKELSSTQGRINQFIDLCDECTSAIADHLKAIFNDDGTYYED